MQTPRRAGVPARLRRIFEADNPDPTTKDTKDTKKSKESKESPESLDPRHASRVGTRILANDLVSSVSSVSSVVKTLFRPSIAAAPSGAAGLSC